MPSGVTLFLILSCKHLVKKMSTRTPSKVGMNLLFLKNVYSKVRITEREEETH